MRYIKPFNENKEIFVDELKDFCENHLAYLIDEGFNITAIERFNKLEGNQYIIVNLDIPGPSSRFVLFYWNYVKDHYIPFLQMLIRRYKLILDPDCKTPTGYVGFNTEMGMKYLSLDQVINDEVSQVFNCRIWGIADITIRVIEKI